MLTGSCLCGAVAYEADAALGPIVHCHCETCRKAHGAAFSSLASVPRAAFRWTKGEALVVEFESSPGKLRKFCSKCGSQLTAVRTGADVVMLRLGCLDTPVAGHTLAHIWRSDGANWYDPRVQTPELLEGFDRPDRVRP
jgi:hypothetical protein